MARRYWLMKSEPDVFSIDDLERKGESDWDGVRNYQARNFMRDEMRTGDRVLFYHSNARPPGVAGIAEVSRESHPDHTAWDPDSPYHDPGSSRERPRWFMVSVCFVEKFPAVVPLDTLKTVPALTGMKVIQRGMRLSVQPVTAEEFQTVVRLGRQKGRS
jgi:predicted RNA-binding protein with PUA-like domain